MGVYYTAKAAIPHLRRRGSGKIILVGSGLGHRGLPERSAYACSNAGVWMLTRVSALELQSSAINVNEDAYHLPVTMPRISIECDEIVRMAGHALRTEQANALNRGASAPRSTQVIFLGDQRWSDAATLVERATSSLCRS
ncbi:MAG: 3-oxoacyl-[acyl-carrier protein] reductase [Betaproteobacteria bacterium]